MKFHMNKREKKTILNEISAQKKFVLKLTKKKEACELTRSALWNVQVAHSIYVFAFDCSRRRMDIIVSQV